MEKLEIDKWYVVAGRGAMRLTALPRLLGGRLSACTLKTPTGYDYWAMAAELIRPVDTAFLDTYERDAGARGIDVSWVPGVRKEL